MQSYVVLGSDNVQSIIHTSKLGCFHLLISYFLGLLTKCQPGYMHVINVSVFVRITLSCMSLNLLI